MSTPTAPVCSECNKDIPAAAEVHSLGPKNKGKFTLFCSYECNYSYMKKLGEDVATFDRTGLSSTIHIAHPEQLSRNAKRSILLDKGSTHYKGSTIEPIEYIAAQGWLSAFCRANVVKYVTRSERSENPMEDLDKAKHYIEFLQAQIRGEM